MLGRSRALALLALASIVFGSFFGGLSANTAAAGDDPSSRFQLAPDPIENGTPVFTPLGLDPNARVTVVLEMLGDSVAAVKASRPDKEVSDTEKDAIKNDLRAKQDAERPGIESLGGRVLAGYQVALNGVKVEVERARLAELAALPNVVAVRPLQVFTLDNATSVPFIGAPSVWQDLGLHGEGIKVGIIDTGIDYTHANFAGPGTVAAFNAAAATSTAPANPALFGPAAQKVKGGTDLVGDAYNASSSVPARRVPHPDPNPLDCNGHGSHVAGTAAGFGVRADGTTFAGPYNATTSSVAFRIGPGVAPRADLYAIRVFGCEGSTNVVVEAIDWAVDHGMNVINMSLGAVFGAPDTADAIAATNAARAGVIVVASAGNSGPAQYITGSPASGSGGISVAAVDSTASFPGASVTLSGGTLATPKTITTINANGASLPTSALPVKVLRTSTGAISLGCSEAEYSAVAGNLVVTRRGTCARVDRAIFGQRHGAAGVVMINNAAGFPPFEGDIFDGATKVTIPFLGALTADTPTLNAADAGSATLTATTVANPGFRGFADFTSGGPRTGDSRLKPEISAPGVSVQSTAIGTGNLGTRLSGTSMAAPHVSGTAALTRQAHPTWTSEDIKAAIVNTGDPAQVAGYSTRLAGSGLVQPRGSTGTQATATGDKLLTSLSFGFKELDENFSEDHEIKVANHGSAAITFNVSATSASGRPHTISLDRTSVTVQPGGEAELGVTLQVPAATAGNVNAFRDVAGLITLTPASATMNNGVTLRVPYYFVPRARSSVRTEPGNVDLARTSTTARISNEDGAITGTADFYAWELESPKTKGLGSNDLRAVGIQSFAFPSSTNPTRRLLVFAVNTWNRWSNASTNEFDILIDVNGDGTPDFDVVAVDLGAVTQGSFNGQLGVFVVNLATGTFSLQFLATAPTDETVLEIPVLTTQLGLTPAKPRFAITEIAGFDLLTGTVDDLVATARFNAYSSSVSQGDFVSVSPGATGSTTLSVDPTEFAFTPAKGFMVVSLDNRNGAKQAQLIPLGLK